MRAAVGTLDVAEGEARRVTLLGARDTHKRLAVSDTMLRQMRERGIIQAVGFGCAHCYEIVEVERFEAEYVTASKVHELSRGRANVGMGNWLTQLLLDAGVRPVCKRPEFYTYLFPRAAAQAALDAHFARQGPSPVGHRPAKGGRQYSMDEVQERLGVTKGHGGRDGAQRPPARDGGAGADHRVRGGPGRF